MFEPSTNYAILPRKVPDWKISGHGISSPTLRTLLRCCIFLFVSTVVVAVTVRAVDAQSRNANKPLEEIFQAHDLVILADVKHGIRDRIEFFSSPELFAEMANAGVRHIAIEMPRVLGRQAKTIRTEADVDAFARDVIRSGHWHFTDPESPFEISDATQYRVASALGRQVLLSRKYNINMIAYDFNNPLGQFRTFNDPVYRCIAELSAMKWLQYGLDNKVTKAQRDAAIMRERLSHDDELADYIVSEVYANGGGKVAVIAGYAHAAVPGGIAKNLESRMRTQAKVVAIFKDHAENEAFHTFLWKQSRLLSIDLSKPPHYHYTINQNTVITTGAPGRYAALNAVNLRDTPSVCHQLALIR